MKYLDRSDMYGCINSEMLNGTVERQVLLEIHKPPFQTTDSHRNTHCGLMVIGNDYILVSGN